MAATKLQANWTAVQHNGVSITRVTNMSFNRGGAVQLFSADTDHFTTVAANLMNRPSANLTSGDPGTVMGITAGTVGTLNATHVDALNASGGNIVYTLINAVLENVQTSGAHAQFGTCTASWQAFSSDGTSNPLSFGRA